MGPTPVEKKAEKSYLSSAVESINPWALKSNASPTPSVKAGEIPEQSSKPPADPGDHATTHLYGQSSRSYPADCPPTNVQWFHAIDIPKHKPHLNKREADSETKTKSPTQPKKFSAFSSQDSGTIEAYYQHLLEEMEDGGGDDPLKGQEPKTTSHSDEQRQNLSAQEKSGVVSKKYTHVPVNEDFLFDVDIEKRELKPVYWLGPIYEVRRGTWFFQEGSNLRPCEENLAAQLEEGFLKNKPWLRPVRARSHSGTNQVTPKPSHESLKVSGMTSGSASEPSRTHAEPQPALPTSIPQPETHRLFGPYMNSVVTYQDATTAWLSTDTMLAWVTSSVYERLAGGGYMSGVKLVRGYSEPAKKPDMEKGLLQSEQSLAEESSNSEFQQRKRLNRRSAPPTTSSLDKDQCYDQSSNHTASKIENDKLRLERQLSSFIENGERTAAEKEEQLQQQEEEEMEGYHTQVGESQSREVEHLILVTHGIGQQLGLRMESINFVHDVNVLRKTIKSVYSESADLKALNSELGSGPGNCRVQVLPVCWRHLLDFPRERQRQGEHDLGDTTDEEPPYPSLDDITVEGVAFARSLISDLALDVLLYQSSYRSEITGIVLRECNRIHQLFKERNPEFNGKVHVMGHSLGSAILFDILCRQKQHAAESEGNGKHSRHVSSVHARSNTAMPTKEGTEDTSLDFKVEDFYCLGSPIGLFQMLEGRTIAARESDHGRPTESVGVGMPHESPATGLRSRKVEEISSISGLPLSVSSPNASQLFNIFHPSDPISYRLEPLISPAMSTLKPQGLPYTKKGIFGNVGNQSLTDIGAKVGQSFSGLWSSLSAGIANNMLNRSLGLSSDEVAKLTSQASPPQSRGNDSRAASDGEGPDMSWKNGKAERKMQLAESAGHSGQMNKSGNGPTLIDDELETLYSQFQKTHGVSAKDKLDRAQDQQRKARKLRVEESKIRALNRNGRVDYTIQESVLDFNPINTIASHLAYWSDVDVSHFVLSQLLSNRTEKMKTKLTN